MRLGIFGGTFDPVHEGHISVAQAVCERLLLDLVLFVPAKNPQLREGKLPQATPDQRSKMLGFAIKSHSKFQISSIELNRTGPSYMFDTLKEIRKIYKSDAKDTYLIIGSDVLQRFEEWYKYKKIMNECTLVIYGRPGNNGATTTLPDFLVPYQNRIQRIVGEEYEVSATRIRELLLNGESNIEGLLPEVENFIRDENIYIESEG